MPFIDDTDESENQYIDGKWSPKLSKIFTDEQGWSSQTGFRFQRAGIVSTKLQAGIYRFEKNDHGLFFEKQTFPTDEAVSLPGLPTDYILNQIQYFWDRSAKYQEHHLLHKRGILLYGTPGCGKTSIARLLCNKIIEQDGVVFSIDDFEIATQAVGEFRSVEPHRPIMTIQEDIEGYFDGTAGPAQLKAALSFLDGQDQTNHVLHLATTNEPEKLADKFIKRPGRFDLIIGIHNPSEETREAYLRHISSNLSDEQLNTLVKNTAGLSLAYLRELISTYVCLEIPLQETLDRLKMDAKKKVLKNPGNSGQFGFTVGYNT